MPLDLDAVRRAHARLPRELRDTPQYVDPALTRALGREVALKFECFNPVRSFKPRGAWTRLDAVPDGTRLLCASAGNFGQGVALAAAGRDLDLEVYAATTASANKLDRMRELGARVTLVGDDYDAAKAVARAQADADPDVVWLEDGADDLVTVGAATIGLELDTAGLDAVLVPVGNGALAVGVASWLAVHAPGVRVVGVCAAGAPAMLESWRDGAVVDHDVIDTMAEGIGVRVPIPSAVAAVRELVHDMVAVEEDAILDAVRCLRDTVGVLVEPAAAVGVAAVRAHGAERLPGARLATILTGANVTAELAARL